MRKYITRPVNKILEKTLGLHLSMKQGFPFVSVALHRFLTVRMDVVNKCNLRCMMCNTNISGSKNEPRKEMPIDLFNKIAADVFPVTRQLFLSVGSEPLLARSFPQMLGTMNQYQIPFTSFITNGTLLNREIIESCIRARLHSILVSFDGATPETYESIRSGADYTRVLDNLRLLQDIKKQFNSDTPELHLCVVLMRSNIEELPDILRLAKNIGALHVNATHMVLYEGLDLKNESLQFHKALTNKFLDESRSLASELGISFVSPPNFDIADTPQQDPVSLCTYPWTELFIHPDGSVYPCCFWYTDERMGNFTAQNFRQIWNGAQFRTLRNRIKTNNPLGPCLQCPIGKDLGLDDSKAFSEKKL